MHCILRYFNPGVFQNQIKVCLRLVYFVWQLRGNGVGKKKRKRQVRRKNHHSRNAFLSLSPLWAAGAPALLEPSEERKDCTLDSSALDQGSISCPSDQSWPWQALSLGWADSHRYLKGRGREALLWEIRDMLGSGGRMWSGHTLAQLVAAVEAGVNC